MTKLSVSPFLLLLLCTLFFSSSSLSTASDTLTPDRPLSNGDTIVSANGTFVLGFFAPNPNSNNRYVGVWYNKVSVLTYVWVANRNNPLVDLTGTLSLTANGTLVITANGSHIVWSSTASSTVGNPVAQILDNGNFVVKDAKYDSSIAWQSFDHPTDALLPGMKLGWNLTSGLNRNMTAWASLTDPSSGSYTFAMDVRGDPQLFMWSGPKRTGRTGPWNGVRFSGNHEMKTNSMFTLQFVQNQEEVYFTFGLKDPSIISRLIMNQTGYTQMLVWLDQQWKVYGYSPNDQCDYLSHCGPMGVCNLDDSNICDCVQGFVPKYPTNWALRDGTGGCIRKTSLDCRNRTDGFVLVRETKLPDTSSSTVDKSFSLDQCRDKCLGNCSCTGYANSDINGTGCIIWTTELTDIRVWASGSQDLYVRVAAADLSPTTDQSHHSGLTAATIIAIPVVLVSVLLLSVACFIRKMRRNKRAKFPNSAWITNPFNYQDTDSKALELPLFDLATIVAATDNFSASNKLGEGGFGPVFMGTLEDGQQIAVKRLAKTSVQGRTEFRNEMELIAKLQHRNLVRLLGCCIHGDQEKMLIYEYMPNKSLDVFLFGWSITRSYPILFLLITITCMR